MGLDWDRLTKRTNKNSPSPFLRGPPSIFNNNLLTFKIYILYCKCLSHKGDWTLYLYRYCIIFSICDLWIIIINIFISCGQCLCFQRDNDCLMVTKLILMAKLIICRIGIKTTDLWKILPQPISGWMHLLHKTASIFHAF